MSEGVDPVLRRRAQMASLASLAKRIGWLFIAVAIGAFVLGMTSSFDAWGPVVIVALVASTLTLAPGMVLGYAVRAAEREDLTGS